MDPARVIENNYTYCAAVIDGASAKRIRGITADLSSSPIDRQVGATRGVDRGSQVDRNSGLGSVPRAGLVEYSMAQGSQCA